MPLLPLLLVLSCGDKDPTAPGDDGAGECPVGDTGADTAGDTGGDDSGGDDSGGEPYVPPDTSHCDADGYVPWLEALVAEYEETGQCPELPAQVPMLDGTLYTPDVQRLASDGEVPSAIGEFYNVRYHGWYTAAMQSSWDQCRRGTEWAGPGAEPEGWLLYVEVYRSLYPDEPHFSGPHVMLDDEPPLFVHSVDPELGGEDVGLRVITQLRSESGDSAYHMAYPVRGADSPYTCGYAVVCIEEYSSTPGWFLGHAPGGRFRGWVYNHVEMWFDPDVDDLTESTVAAPMDFLVEWTGDIDCTTYTELTNYEGPWSGEAVWPNWGPECDGVDNDYDGEIDESMDIPHPLAGVDKDDNGIPDCQQDCDGDGIPNYDDYDDIDECTPPWE